MRRERGTSLLRDFKFRLRAHGDVWKIFIERNDQVREVARRERVCEGGEPKQSWQEDYVHFEEKVLGLVVVEWVSFLFGWVERYRQDDDGSLFIPMCKPVMPRVLYSSSQWGTCDEGAVYKKTSSATFKILWDSCCVFAHMKLACHGRLGRHYACKP